MKKRILASFVAILIGATGLFVPAELKAQHLTFGTYSGQSEITASGSITFTNGFTVPAGSNFRAYISSSANCVPLASAVSANQNYVISNTVKRSGITQTSQLDVVNLTVCELNQTVQYFDGLGRPLQTVTVKGSPSLKDIVQPVAYDAFGREAIKYLPYADAGTANGSYKTNALTSGAGVLAFYNPAGSTGTQQANGMVRTAYPFSQTVFEASPLNRVLEQGAPGLPWQPATTRAASGRTVVSEYGSNIGTGAEAVKLWVVTSNGASCGTNVYAANKLYKTVIKDENWTTGKIGTTEEYKDFEDRVVLKRIWETEAVSLSTYYVYDDFGNLRYVIPAAVTATTFTEADAVFGQFIYGYKYDGRQRVVEKKIPGKDWEYMVYNKLDQVVLTQDGVQRSKANQDWTSTKYDVFGRVVITGIHTYGTAANTSYRAAIQTLVDAQSSQWENKTTTGIGYTTNLSYPTTALSSTLSIQYYDDYTAPGMPAAYNQSSNAAYSKKLKGLPTASKVNVLGTAELLWTVNYYDEEARVIKTYKQHYQGGSANVANYDEISNIYNFAGELLNSTREHRNGAAVTTIATTYEYDHMGRKKLVKEQINTNPEVVLSRLAYNEVGQLLKKELHSTDNGATFLQNTTYAYNERGWMKTGTSAQFSTLLKYEDGTSPQYNGNIANQNWGAAASLPNVYTYSYDKLNRLLNGTSTGVVMSEVLTYDVMGNIKTMNRDAAATASTYNYTGNRLSNITGGTLATGNYSYDVNGNATTDGRTGVVLTYNLLNLPATAKRTTPAPVVDLTYTYDASGNKLRKISTGASASTRHYVNGIEYNGNTIETIRTEEGLARNNSGTYSYEYNLTDHLGNVRYTFNKHPTTGAIQRIQADNYYAFGQRKSVLAGTNKYLYNGKEIQDELGEQYDYGARFYDPVVGRWNVVDPKAELLEMSSPYVYSLNSPVSFIDKDGELPIYINGKTSNDNERGDAIYWNKQLLRTIASSGIPNPGGTAHYVDGNRYLYRLANNVRVKNSGFTEGQVAEGRREAGYRIGKEDFQNILSQLAKDPKTGKITEKIQIYTHSRGAAFGAGYTEALLEMIKNNSGKFADANNVIDYVLNLAPHQSDAIDAPKGANSFSIDHDWDILSGDDMGNNIGFKTNTAAGSLGLSHQNKTFSREVGAFIQSFQKSKGNNNQLIDDFVNKMRSYGIKVTVN